MRDVIAGVEFVKAGYEVKNVLVCNRKVTASISPWERTNDAYAFRRVPEELFSEGNGTFGKSPERSFGNDVVGHFGSFGDEVS